MSTPARRWLLAYALGVTCVVGALLLAVPLQVSDDLGNMLRARQRPMDDLVLGEFGRHDYWRPLFWGLLGALVRIGEGREFLFIKLFQVGLFAALLVLFVRLVPIRLADDRLPALVAVCALLGGHTFGPLLREIHPVNMFLVVAVLSLAAVNLGLARPGPLQGLLVLSLMGVSLLWMEQGILVYVCFAALWFTGARGVPGRLFLALSALVAVYLFVRLGLAGLAPGGYGREAGFGFDLRTPEEIRSLFEGREFLFYGYNVLSSAMTVLFAEPRDGIFSFVRDTVRGQLPVWRGVQVVAATATTVTIAIWSWSRLPHWRTRDLEDDDRLLGTALALLGSSAVMSFPFARDLNMSIAGIYFALVGFMGLRHVIGLFRSRKKTVLRVALIALVLLVAGGWGLRSLALYHSLRVTALTNRKEWLGVDDWLQQQGIRVRPEDEVFVRRLRTQALNQVVVDPTFFEGEFEWIVGPQ